MSYAQVSTSTASKAALYPWYRMSFLDRTSSAVASQLVGPDALTTWVHFRVDLEHLNYGLAGEIDIDGDGMAHAPTGPGLGIAVDWELIDSAKSEITPEYADSGFCRGPKTLKYRSVTVSRPYRFVNNWQ